MQIAAFIYSMYTVKKMFHAEETSWSSAELQNNIASSGVFVCICCVLYKGSYRKLTWGGVYFQDQLLGRKGHAFLSARKGGVIILQMPSKKKKWSGGGGSFYSIVMKGIYVFVLDQEGGVDVVLIAFSNFLSITSCMWQD